MFYSIERAEDCDVAAHGDMLLFQWSTADWGAGRFFSIDMTRQFIPGLSSLDPPMEADFPILQLSWRLFFEPTKPLLVFGSGNQWCREPASLPAFVDLITRLPVFGTVVGLTAQHVSLTYENVE